MLRGEQYLLTHGMEQIQRVTPLDGLVYQLDAAIPLFSLQKVVGKNRWKRVLSSSNVAVAA